MISRRWKWSSTIRIFEIRTSNFSEFFEFLQITAVTVIIGDWNFAWMTHNRSWVRSSTIQIFEIRSSKFEFFRIFEFLQITAVTVIIGDWNFSWMTHNRSWVRSSTKLYKNPSEKDFFCSDYSSGRLILIYNCNSVPGVCDCVSHGITATVLIPEGWNLAWTDLMSVEWFSTIRISEFRSLNFSEFFSNFCK